MAHPLLPPDPAPSALHPTARTLLDTWFGDGLRRGWPSAPRRDLWFNSTPALDDALRADFGAAVEAALAGGLTDWSATPAGRLARVLLLDQLPRNLFRRTARAFAGDAAAQAETRAALAAGDDRRLPPVGRVFLLMPLMHAEDLGLQALGVQAFEALANEAPPPAPPDALADHARFARLHHDIVARFGRFPHRNAVLGRPDTPAEADFLRDGPRFGQ